MLEPMPIVQDPASSKTASPRRRDPVALAVMGIAVLVLLIGIVLAWRALSGDKGSRTGAEAPVSLSKHIEIMLASLRAQFASLERPSLPWEESLPQQQSTAKAKPTRAVAKSAFPAIPPPVLGNAPVLPPGGSWTYQVAFGPDFRTAGRLMYSASPAPSSTPALRMQWAPNGAKATSWDFGVFAPGHPSHQNVRFPGFFMHAAYFPFPLKAGDTISWSFPWQLADASVRPGRERRFEARVAGWEDVSVPAGRFASARLNTVLRYVEGDSVRAEVRNTLWYAPQARQVVRILWSGRAPDEGATEILAELSEIRLP